MTENAQRKPLVGIVMGSDSDLGVMEIGNGGVEKIRHPL